MRSNHKNGVCRLIDKATEGIVRYFQDIDFLNQLISLGLTNIPFGWTFLEIDNCTVQS